MNHLVKLTVDAMCRADTVWLWPHVPHTDMPRSAPKLSPPRLTREVCPPEYSASNLLALIRSSIWPDEGEPMELVKLDFAKWQKQIARCNQLFKKHVYDNPEATQVDFRQHRKMLCALIVNGENMAAFLELQKGKEAKLLLALIDRELEPIFKVFFEWHGPVEGQLDLPDSLKAAYSDVVAGRIEPFEFPEEK